MKTLKISLQILSLFVLFCCKPTQEKESALSPEQLESAYKLYQQSDIQQRRFKYESVIHLIRERSRLFQIEEIGKSVEHRPIFQLSAGNGPTKVMLWSQMHGNESTATMALFDLMNFLEGQEDDFVDIRKKILSKLQLRIIPMVNPDGMNQWQRRNILDIDLNRDAIALNSPESKILKEARDSFAPHFGFNLHDQQIYYNVSQSPKPATISVLAPAYNYATDVNEVRENAMKVIVSMNELLQKIIPGQVGKYDDAFEPRAFGDNFQKWGTSTILIESGGYPDDPEKQYIRKLNFMVILHALIQIADQSYQNYVLEDYYAIPDNDLKLMDLLIHNLSLQKANMEYQADIAIRRREVEGEDGFHVNGSIDDLGDLSVFFGYETLDASGLEVREGKIYESSFDQIADISKEKAYELLQQGYLAIKVKEAKGVEIYDLPILILSKKTEIPFGVRTGGYPNFYLAKDEELKFALVNGYLIDLKNKKTQVYHMKVL